MRARVTKAFPGVEDGKIYPREIAVGEVVTGDLAREAAGAGLADEIDEVAEAKAQAKADAEARKRAEAEAAAQADARVKALRDIAKTAKVDLGKANTEAEIIAALTAAGVAVPA